MKKAQQGFTLVELLVSMVILGVVLTGVVRMFSRTGQYHTAQEMLVGLTQDLRAVRQLMMQEIRESGCDPLNKGTFGLQVDGDDRYNTDGNSIHFTRDVDNGDGDGVPEPDGKSDDSNEDVSYYRTNDSFSGATGVVMLAGDSRPGCLRRNTGGGGQPVMANVTEFRLYYYDVNGQELADAQLSTMGKLEKVATVRVFIRAQVEVPRKVSAQAQAQELDFRVTLRNG